MDDWQARPRVAPYGGQACVALERLSVISNDRLYKWFKVCAVIRRWSMLLARGPLSRHEFQKGPESIDGPVRWHIQQFVRLTGTINPHGPVAKGMRARNVPTV